MIRRAALALSLLGIALLGGTSLAQDFGNERKVEPGAVSAVPAAVRAGETGRLVVKLVIEEGWHVYAVDYTAGTSATDIDVKEWPAGLSAGSMSSDPEAHDFEAFGEIQPVLEGEVTITREFRVAADAEPGKRTIQGRVRWGACNDQMCLPPVREPFELEIEVLPAAAGAAPPQRQPPVFGGTRAETAGGDAGNDAGGGTGGLLLAAFVAGLLTLLTPCVFPLLPVTVSFFSKQEGNPVPRSLAYAGGIIFTIMGIGLVFRGGLALFATGDVFNLAVGLLFIALALSLWGVFDLRLPGFLIDRSTQKSSSGGVMGAFFMAVTLALTSFSCSMPFLAIMFAEFEAGGVSTAVLGLLVYSATFALPFFLCSLFPALLSALPKAGGWMNAIKVTMGFVEFGLAFKFLRTVALNNESNVLPRVFVLALWTACAIAAALYLFGFFAIGYDSKPNSIGPFRMVFAIGFLSLGFYLLPGVFGRPLDQITDGFIQTQPDELWSTVSREDLGGLSVEGARGEHAGWVRDDWDGSLARAAESGRPVLFDFTGDG